jgi:hypothetical protein
MVRHRKGWRGEPKRHSIAARKGAKRHGKKFLTGRSDPARDRMQHAKPPGERKSRRGKIYYEYRANRADSGKKL